MMAQAAGAGKQGTAASRMLDVYAAGDWITAVVLYPCCTAAAGFALSFLVLHSQSISQFYMIVFTEVV
jgi:hypothetical protein